MIPNPLATFHPFCKQHVYVTVFFSRIAIFAAVVKLPFFIFYFFSFLILSRARRRTGASRAYGRDGRTDLKLPNRKLWNNCQTYFFIFRLAILVKKDSILSKPANMLDRPGGSKIEGWRWRLKKKIKNWKKDVKRSKNSFFLFLGYTIVWKKYT